MGAVAQRVTAVIAAAQTLTPVEGVLGAAAVRHALLLPVHQRVDEQVHRALVRTAHDQAHLWRRGEERR